MCPPCNGAATSLRGVYARLGLVDPAIREFQALLQIAPSSPATRTRLGTLYRHKGLLENALDELHAAFRLNPDYAPARYQLELVPREIASRR